MNRYPTVDTGSHAVNHRAVELETLSTELIPIRDAFLKLFDGVAAKSRGELHRLELGLTVTEHGEIAFAVGSTTPSITLTLESRQGASGTRSVTSKSRATKKPDVVEIDSAPPESPVPARGERENEGVRSIVLDDN